MAVVRIGREEFLQILESVSPGLSPKDTIDQSASFCFKGGEVMTFNEEIACRHRTKFPKDFEAAVTAQPLLKVLRRLTEDQIGINLKDSHLVVIGKRRQSGIRIEESVTLPFDMVEQPKDLKFKPLHDDFTDAVKTVEPCAGKEAIGFLFACVHISPDFVEACDNLQFCRFKVKSGFKEDILVRREAIRHVAALDLDHFAETESWVHFKGSDGLILSCRRFMEEYMDLNPLFDVRGEKAQLPSALVEAVERAEIFSEELGEDKNKLLVQLRPGKMRLKAEGVTGWYAEVKKLRYRGRAMTFLASPPMLKELVNRQLNCIVNQERLKANGGRWIYATLLWKVEEAEDGV